MCEEMGFKHPREFSNFREPFAVTIRGKEDRLPRIPTFQNLATLLAEKGEHEWAIEVCEMAL